IPLHDGRYLFLRNRDRCLAALGATHRIFEMKLQGSRKVGPGQHPEELREMDHALAERSPLRLPVSLGVLHPQEILDRHSAEMRARDAKAVDPPSQSALDGGMGDVVIHAHRLRIEILEYDVQVPDGRPHYADTGV